jgi:hypothetical protein
MTEPKPVAELLTALGDKPTTVAARLRKMGHKGSPGGCQGPCPIRKYLLASGYPVAFVGLRVAGAGDPFSYTEVKMSPALCEFVRLFDGEHFPSLIEEETR